MNQEEGKQEEIETITVSFGEETFAPIQYQNFKFGSIYYKTQVRPGETPEEAFDRAWKFVESCAKKQFIAKRDGFWERHQESMKPAKGGR